MNISSKKTFLNVLTMRPFLHILLMAAPPALLLCSAYGSVNAAYASVLGELCVTFLPVSILILILFALYFLTASITVLEEAFRALLCCRALLRYGCSTKTRHSSLLYLKAPAKRR